MWITLVRFQRAVDHVHDRFNQDPFFSIHGHHALQQAVGIDGNEANEDVMG